MLSKSQAKLFFWTFTVGFSGVFLWLTVDTIRVVPHRSNDHLITGEVIRGKEIWEKNNCMGCHTLLGEGAYYAPELTKVVERRGEPWLRVFLKDPQAMYPGKRKMVNYHFTDREISDVIAFLSWVGKIDTNGFPAKPDLAPQGGQAQPKLPKHAQANHNAPPKIYGSLCKGCHAVGGEGGKVGPALDGIGARKERDWLAKWLRDPAKIKPNTTMPKLPLSDEDIDALSTWLAALK